MRVDGRQPRGEDVKRLRKKLGLSQRQFADIYGCTGKDIADVEVEYRYAATERAEKFFLVLLACKYTRRFRMQKATKKELREEIRKLTSELTEHKVALMERIYGMPLIDTLRKALRAKRKTLGIRVKQVAFYMGISESSVWNIEKRGKPELISKEFEAINKVVEENKALGGANVDNLEIQ